MRQVIIYSPLRNNLSRNFIEFRLSIESHNCYSLFLHSSKKLLIKIIIVYKTNL